MALFNEYFLQLGAIGVIIIGLTYFSRSLFVFFMEQLKTKENENKAIEQEFRLYLQTKEQQHLSIIQEHALIYKELITVLNESRVEHAKIYKDLTSVLTNLKYEIEQAE